MTDKQRFASVWDALEDTPQEAARIKVRSALMMALAVGAVQDIDLLRVHHEKIEAWILEQAGVTFDASAAPGALRVVA